MSIFSKETSGRRYTDAVQKTAEGAKHSMQMAEERMGAYKQMLDSYKDVLQQYDADFHKRMGDLDQIIQNIEGIKLQDQSIALVADQTAAAAEKVDSIVDKAEYIKEKQECVLKNFPILEANIVEKLKNSQADVSQDLAVRVEALEKKLSKKNVWTKVLLWFSLLINIATVAGVAVLLLHFMGYLVF